MTKNLVSAVDLKKKKKKSIVFLGKNQCFLGKNQCFLGKNQCFFG